MLPDLRDDHPALAHPLLLSDPVAEDTTWHQRRIGDLRNLLGRWAASFQRLRLPMPSKPSITDKRFCDLCALLEKLSSVAPTGPDDPLY